MARDTTHHKSSHASHDSHGHTRPKNKKKSGDPLADAYARLQKGQVVSSGHADHPMGPHASVREIDYNGHRITIQTQYEIKVDGKPITGHIYVDNEGKVSTHALPAYSFVSTVDLVKKLIDAFPGNFGKKK